ncbi:MAG: hypothetical protein AB7E60_01805 [Sphingobium sp.]
MIRRSYHKQDVHCAAEGCDMIVGRGQMFCRGHYFSLPKGLRDALWSAWRAAMNARRGETSTIEQGRINRAYQQAFQHCCEHLRRVPATSAEAMTTIAYADGAPVAYAEGRRL